MAKTGAPDLLDVFRHLDELAVAVRGRTDLWTKPLRLMRVTGKVLDEAPPAARVALAAVLGRGGSGRTVPRWLSTRVQRHIADFDHLYSLARRESNLYSLSMLYGMRDRWQPLLKSLQDAGVEYEAIEHLDRYMAVRLNFLTATGGDFGPGAPALRKTLLPALEATASMARQMERKLVDLVEEYAAKELGGKPLSAAQRARIPFAQLGTFGKLQKLLPADDPAWRELGAWMAARKAAGVPVQPQQLQGAIGEFVALRTPGVVAFLERETARVLAADPTLAAEGWRVLVQHRPVGMAQASRSVKEGANLPAGGLGGNGESFDVSVWLVKDAPGENPVAMPVVRVQVKSGKEDNVLDGVSQSLASDEWRQFSDTVTLDFGSAGAPRPRNFELKPPDTFSVVRVLVGADVPQSKALRAKMPPGTDLNVFKLPLAGAEFGKIGGIMARRLGS